MGQYYNIITKTNRINGVYTVYDRSIKKYKSDKVGYMLAKLTEHSWIGNRMMDSLSAKLFQCPMRVAWVGDYTDQLDVCDLPNKDLDYSTMMELFRIAWNDENTKFHSLIITEFEYSGTILVNHSKKLYLKMDKYIKASEYKYWGDSWCAHPLSLLTAIGNGLGGGDYSGINEDKVGIWAFDVISFENEQNECVFTNHGYKEFEIRFNEKERNEEVK